MADKIVHGTTFRGIRSPNAKLTEEQVVTIRERRIARESYSDIAKDFGVSRATITFVCIGGRWGHFRTDLIDRCKAIPDDGATLKRGGQNPSAKLTNERVLSIKDELARGRSRKQIAADYGMSVSAIDRIAIGRTWTHI
jgi:uncharacterized protein YerC